MKNEPGYVYILKDDHFKRGVKIGRAKDVAKRMRSLVTANPWLSVYVKIRTCKWIELEKATHNIIKLVAKKKQVKNSEFYLIEPEKAKRIMLEFARLIDKDDFKISTGEGMEIDTKTAKPVADKQAVSETKVKQSNFAFSSVRIPVGAELQFTEAPITVTVADEKNKVTYRGQPYSLSGFVKAFHPHPSKSGAYQGPKFFTYKGLVLNELRKGVSADRSESTKVDNSAQSQWKNIAQLARHIATQGGNAGAANGIGLFISGKRRCVKTSKWRAALESAGVKFNESDIAVSVPIAN